MVISKKYSVIVLTLLLGAFLLFTPFSALRADSSLLSGQTGINEISAVYGGNSQPDIRTTIAKIINIALSFMGIIFIVLIIFAGFKYMTAAGNEEKTSEALKLLRNAVIGLIIILMAWGITRYSFCSLSRAANGAIVSSWCPMGR